MKKSCLFSKTTSSTRSLSKCSQIQIDHFIRTIKNVPTKGQIKPKADCRTVDSSKKQTNEIVLFAFFAFQSKLNKFVRSFFGRIYRAPILPKFCLNAKRWLLFTISLENKIDINRLNFLRPKYKKLCSYNLKSSTSKL